MRDRFRILCILLFAFVSRGYGQATCPENIGFESGNFNNWTCFDGNIARGTGTISVSNSGPLNGRHTILQNSFPQLKDQFGNFPVNCPNGSGYSIKLGNESTGAQVDRVTYTFTVPADKNEYSIIYNYAIVFQDPGHPPADQPKFTSKVYDESAGEYLSCGAFEYVASGGLPGFEKSPLSTLSNIIWYKAWSPVTIKLVGCAGKRITIEFTVNDCAQGGHFGYAYLDVNENCTSPITGNVYCNGATGVTLTAPFGFQQYNWYTSDFVTLLGTSNILKFSPVPVPGTRYALEIIPYPGLGCRDTLYTEIQLSPEAFHFNLIDTFIGCVSLPADITQSFVTQGSTPGLKLSYFTDSSGINYLPTPAHVTDPGTYFIKAVNTAGCTEMKKLRLSFRDVNYTVVNPPQVCYPAVADITASSVVSSGDPGTTFSYWKDQLATQPLPNPQAIGKSGTYYVKVQNGACYKMGAVSVWVWDTSHFVTNPVTECIRVDITAKEVTNGSASIFTYTPWLDALASVPVPDPGNVTASGTYFIKATSSAYGCSFIKPVQVVVKPVPDFAITDPATVNGPTKVDLMKTISVPQQYSYTFWTDDKATKPLVNPNTVGRTGTYYIKGTDNNTGCTVVKPVNVTIIIPYHPIIKYPNSFSPNKDGVNDGFRVTVSGDVTYKVFRIFNRWGQVVFESKDPEEYWYGEKNGLPVPPGTYYWIVELVNNNNGDFYRRTGSITLFR